MARPSLYVASTWRPPAPFVTTPVPWTPPVAELTVAAVVRRYGDGPADIARRFLREIARGEQCKTANRDMTGAFPVVAVA